MTEIDRRRFLASLGHAGAALAAGSLLDFAPQRLEPPPTARRMTFKLPARSYTVVQLATI